MPWHTLEVVCHILLAHNVQNLKLELTQEIKPSSLPATQVSLRLQVSQAGMVSKNHKLAAH